MNDLILGGIFLATGIIVLLIFLKGRPTRYTVRPRTDSSFFQVMDLKFREYRPKPNQPSPFLMKRKDSLGIEPIGEESSGTKGSGSLFPGSPVRNEAASQSLHLRGIDTDQENNHKTLGL